MKGKEFFKSVGFRSVIVLLCIALVSGGLLSILNFVWHVDVTVDLTLCKKVYDVENVEFTSGEVNPEFEKYGDKGIVNLVINVSDGGAIVVSSGKGGYAGDVTCYVAIRGGKIVGALISAAVGETLLDQLTSEDTPSKYVGFDISVDIPETSISTGASAVHTLTALNNSINTACYYAVNALKQGENIEGAIKEALKNLADGSTYTKGVLYDGYVSSDPNIVPLMHFNSGKPNQFVYSAKVTVKAGTVIGETTIASDTVITALVVFETTATSVKFIDVSLVSNEEVLDKTTKTGFLYKYVMGKTTLSSANAKRAKTIGEYAIGQLAIETLKYAKADTAKYLNYLKALSDITYNKLEVDKAITSDLGEVKFVATATHSTYGGVYGIVVEVKGIGEVGKTTVSALISTATHKVVEVAISVDGTSMSPDYDLPAEKLAEYKTIAIISATAYDSFNGGLVTGATPDGTETSRTIKNAFKIIANYYYNSVVKFNVGYLIALQDTVYSYIEVVPTSLPTTGHALYVASAQYNGEDVIAIVASGNKDTETNDFIVSALISKSTKKIVKIVISVDGTTLDGCELPQSKLDAYKTVAITSATVFDTFDGAIQSGATHTSYAVRNALRVIATYFSSVKA